MFAYTTVRFVYGDSFDPANQGELFRQYMTDGCLPAAILRAAISHWHDEISQSIGGGPPLVAVQVWWQGEKSVVESSWPKSLPGWRGHPKRLPSLRAYRRALVARALAAIADRAPAAAPLAALPRAGRNRGLRAASRQGGRRAGGTSATASRRTRG